MSLPGNGIFVVRGEVSLLLTAMRRGQTRWSSHSHQEDEDTLLKNFQELKETLNKIDDLRLIQPLVYLEPFLEIIRSGETTGPITSLALSAVGKFLSYGLMDPTLSSVPKTVHQIADAITHARFVGTDHSSDGVVLMKILQVLRTLVLAPEGITLTNESLCEIMLSCFRICFETRLNELLRRTAEHYLKDMVHLIFMRLPQFSEDSRAVKQIKMRPGVIEQTRSKRRRSFRVKKDENTNDHEIQSPTSVKSVQINNLSTSNSTLDGGTTGVNSSNIVDMQGTITRNPSNADLESSSAAPSEQMTTSTELSGDNQQQQPQIDEKEKEKDEKNIVELANSPINIKDDQKDQREENSNEGGGTEDDQEYVNQRGIRFAQQIPEEVVLMPYGLACVRELFRFLISLCNPADKQNTDVMVHLGLTLLTVAFEVGADNIGKYSTLLILVKNDLCRNLFSLLHSDRLSVFAANLQLCFLMFESQRKHLKFQLESYLTKLIDIVVVDSGKITYEHKEVALDNILQLWRIPGLVTELYVNYDCNMYCTNLYEDLTKLLAKNAFSTTSGVYHTHMLSLNSLLTVIQSIENNCRNKIDHSSELNEKNIKNGDNNDITNDQFENIENIIEENSRQKSSDVLPKKSDLMACKNIKKWLPMGTEHFNHKPKKGIQFLQEHGVLKPELDPYEIALFLKENTSLDKKMIGEFISNRSNLQILDAFVKTFDFHNMRIDEALRNYLETFRLPGEAPTISLLLEHFAEHWHKSNGEPFADVDAAFTLAYAVIMLNVDQHNQNAKKQTIPMTCSAFKKNLKGVNGNNDFDDEMLDEIYNAIKNDEIVMPAEQTGLVRENYLWKVLLRKGESKDGQYYCINNDEYDPELFSLIFGPIITVLSFIYERSEERTTFEKAMEGFKKCAYVSSRFNMTNNIDTIILTICKFTTFHSVQKNINGAINFGNNIKAQLALKAVAELFHLYGDNIREGWKHLFSLILSLYSHNLLPKCYIEAEDFIQSSGKIVLVYEEPEHFQKQDTSLFSSLYSYMVSGENLSKIPTVEEQQYIDIAAETIKDCNLEQIITDTKFLHDDSLKELITALVDLSRGPDTQKLHTYNYNENITVFFLELLVKVVIQNRDRVMVIWQTVRDHLYTLVMNASVFDYQFLLERSVINLLRIAIRLMRNEDMSPIVLQSLRMLLLLKSSTLSRISRQVSFGLYELLKTSAQNIHTQADWTIIFTLLECIGAGAQPPKPVADNKSDGDIQSDEEVNLDKGYTSDSELIKKCKEQFVPPGSPGGGGWILVGNDDEVQPVVGRTLPPNQYNLSLDRNLGPHDACSLMKCCESLAFLVRDVAHITPYNFDDCVHCIRTFVEASLHGSKRLKVRQRTIKSKRPNNKRRDQRSPISSSPEDSDDDDLPSGYHQISIQLLDLMHTLHTRTAQIFKWWAEEGGTIAQDMSLWTQGWCPLLQGIARLCCDVRKEVRMSAITYLQRALLVHDLQTLTGPEWEACFHRVLFPLLAHLLQSIEPYDCAAMEETRMRAATVLSKVFLHHLTPLLSLSTFSNLWLIILDYIDKYMHADKSDLLYEAIPESLKNMLLVMDSAGVFNGPDGAKNQLWSITWDRISSFLPNMKEELFKEINEKEMHTTNMNYEPPQAIKSPESPPPPISDNLTKNSIILQPFPQVSSHLFSHLGQMVSTPIPPTRLPEPLSSPTSQQQPQNMTYLFSQNDGHQFPVLLSNTTYSNNPVIPPNSTIPIYNEYIENPYNRCENPKDNELILNLDLNENSDKTENNGNGNGNSNYFQSSAYFPNSNPNSDVLGNCELLYDTNNTTTNNKKDEIGPLYATQSQTCNKTTDV